MRKQFHPDWDCPKCNRTKIFSSKDKCPGCGLFRSKASSYKSDGPNDKPDTKPGDWICAGCLTNNFASRTECFKCRKFKDTEDNKRQPEPRPGDWLCINCLTNNFAGRTTCFKCDAGPKILDVVKQPTIKPGDWLCPDCNCNNFGSRTVCYKCSKPRSNNNNSNNDEKEELEDKTKCKICFDRDLSASIPCGHLSMCYECAIQVSSCPICRAEYDKDIDIKKIVIN